MTEKIREKKKYRKEVDTRDFVKFILKMRKRNLLETLRGLLGRGS